MRISMSDVYVALLWTRPLYSNSHLRSIELRGCPPRRPAAELSKLGEVNQRIFYQKRSRRGVTRGIQVVIDLTPLFQGY